ncbi:glycosyltransferase family protein [Flindersiella endophytica]
MSGVASNGSSADAEHAAILLSEARRQLAEQAHQLRCLAWRLDSFERSRAWRMAAAVREVVRRPSRIARLPYELRLALKARPLTDGAAEPPAQIEESDPGLLPARRPDLPVQVRHPLRFGITAATILSPASAAGLRFEWRQADLEAGDWQRRPKRIKPNLLLVETVPREHPWSNLLRRRLGEAERLLDWFHKRGIPTVLWNTLGPGEAEAYDRIAQDFDHVFTVDPDSLPRYRALLGHDRLGVLKPAVQPRLHNPASVPGSRYLDVLAISDLWNADLERVSRTAYKVFSFDDADVPPTVLPREVLEFIASGTPVVSTEHPALAREFGESVVFAPPDERAGLLRNLLGSAHLRDRLAHRAQRTVFEQHTYGHRVDAILQAIGSGGLAAAHRSEPRPVSVVVPTMRVAQVAHAIDQVARQRYQPLQLVLVLHGVDLSVDDVREQALSAGLESVVVLEVDGSQSFATAWRRGVGAADGAVVARMDDGNLYGEHYLTDLVQAFRYTDAGVVGKLAHYAHVQGSGATVLRYPGQEHRYTRTVHPGTLAMRSDVLRAVPFDERSSDVSAAFLTSCEADGVRIYASDRFSFVWCRQGDYRRPWRVDEGDVLGNGRVEFFGYPDRHVNI